MNILKWFGWRGSARSLVMSSYKRGLSRTKRHDPQGAMEDFTAAIEAPDAPADVKAMALYNRALLFAAARDISRANDDLKAVLVMEAALPEIKLAAKRRLERMRNRPILNAPVRPAKKASNKTC
jgi:hypothetical protein